MTYPRNGGIDYEVYCSAVVAKSIRDVHQRAVQEGQGEAMVAAFRDVVEHFRRRAARLGEPLYRLPALRIEVRHALFRPIAVQFGVCEDRPLVFIKSVTLLSLPGL
jgi:hypothetical protein